MTIYKSKLFKRYFTLIVVIVIVCLGVLGSSMILMSSSNWWTQQLSILRTNSKNISDVISDIAVVENGALIISDEKIASVSDTLELLSNATNSEYFICNSKGEVILCRACATDDSIYACSEHKGMVMPIAETNKAMSSGYSDYTTLGDVFPTSNFVVAVPIKVDSVALGAVFAVENAVNSLLPYILSIAKMFIISMFAALIIAFIASYAFSYGMAKPLTEMTEGTRHFARGDFTYRVNEKHKKGELKELAAALNKMADDLAADERATQSFIANVSHELKTPMTTIGGFIDGILDGTVPASKARDYLNTVSTEVKRLSRLVVAMLNLSKIESGETQIKPITYDVSAQIFETLLSFERTIESNNITIKGFEEMEGINIRADKDLLHQVIYNLLDNAVKFTPQNGTIELSAKNEDNNTVVKIKNSGDGISDEEISRIFERFYKVDKSRSFDIKGVGLGLHIVKTIIRMHAGEIYANSKQGEYTEFIFSIPLN